MIETKYGAIDETSLLLYNEDLKNRTFALLYLYEQQPFETYQRSLNDLISGAISFQKIKLQKHPDFCKYIEKLVAILEPQPLQIETEHDFVRRHILDAVNILGRMIQDFQKVVSSGN